MCASVCSAVNGSSCSSSQSSSACETCDDHDVILLGRRSRTRARRRAASAVCSAPCSSASAEPASQDRVNWTWTVTCASCSRGGACAAAAPRRRPPRRARGRRRRAGGGRPRRDRLELVVPDADGAERRELVQADEELDLAADELRRLAGGDRDGGDDAPRTLRPRPAGGGDHARAGGDAVVDEEHLVAGDVERRRACRAGGRRRGRAPCARPQSRSRPGARSGRSRCGRRRRSRARLRRARARARPDGGSCGRRRRRAARAAPARPRRRRLLRRARARRRPCRRRPTGAGASSVARPRRAGLRRASPRRSRAARSPGRVSRDRVGCPS